jgi:hypothetical protein
MKVSWFLGNVGFNTVAALKDKAYPAKPEDKKVLQIGCPDEVYIDPPPSSLVIWKKFGLWVQGEKESSHDIYLEAEKAIARLWFKDLQERLRDQLVVGLQSEPIMEKLFAEDPTKLDWEQASKMAFSM